jgi:hypothetical protein
LSRFPPWRPARPVVRFSPSVGRYPDDADHRPGREPNPFVHLDPAVLDLEQARQRRLHLVDQLAEAGDERGDAPVDRADIEDVDDERVARLGTEHGHRSGGAVHLLEVDLGDQVLLAADLAAEAVVRLEPDGRSGLDLEHGVELGPESPDHVLLGNDVVDCRDGAQVATRSR